jgi:hypothetical protein
MRFTRHTPYRIWNFVMITIVATGLFSGGVGCAARSTPSVSDAAYLGPKLTLGSSGNQHALFMEAPSAGWVLLIDRVIERRGGFDVFASIRRPDPRFLHAQVVVSQRAIVGVSQEFTLRVCARILDADGGGDPDYSAPFTPPDEPTDPAPK